MFLLMVDISGNVIVSVSYFTGLQSPIEDNVPVAQQHSTVDVIGVQQAANSIKEHVHTRSVPVTTQLMALWRRVTPPSS